MEKEKQLKEFNFHGLKLIGVYNPNLDSWWFRGKEVYRCLGVSQSAFSKYMKQVDDKHKKNLNSTKVNKIFDYSKLEFTKKVNNHYETLISESGLYRLATCLGKTKECEEFKDFVFEDLLVSLRKAEQKTMKEKFDTLEERIEYLETQNAGLRADLNYWKSRMKQVRYYSKDDRKNPRSKANQRDWIFDYDNY